MVLDITQSILKSLLLNQKVGTIISSKKHEKLQIWKQELTPYLEELQNKGYIEQIKNKIELKYKIKKPITLNTIKKLQTLN